MQNGNSLYTRSGVTTVRTKVIPITLPSNRVHLIQITTQDTAGHPWPTSLLSSPDLSDLCDDASRLAPPLMAHQPTAGSPFPYSPWDPPPLRRPCSRRLTSRSLTSSLPLYLI